MPAHHVATIRNRRDAHARNAKASSVYSNPSPRLRARVDPCAGLDFDKMGDRWEGTPGGPTVKERALVEDARVARATVAKCKERITTHERTIASQQTLNVRLRERVDALESTVQRILPKTSRLTVLAELEHARDAAELVKEAEAKALKAAARLEAEIRARDAERRRVNHRVHEVARERNAVGERHRSAMLRLRDAENEARFANAEVRRLKTELARPKPPPPTHTPVHTPRLVPVEDKSVNTEDKDTEEAAITRPVLTQIPALTQWHVEPERVTVVIEVREPTPPPLPPVVEERVVLCIVVVEPEPEPVPEPMSEPEPPTPVQIIESSEVETETSPVVCPECPKVYCPKVYSPKVKTLPHDKGDKVSEGESVVTVSLTPSPPKRTPSTVASKVEALRKSRRFTRSGRHIERQFSAATKMMRKRRD